ncbi:MAG TPA: hypothetical protein VFF95_13425, partial [Candidatus Binatus sp.]|nr:hypothetical protein [Candidatus Binatus sp.]
VSSHNSLPRLCTPKKAQFVDLSSEVYRDKNAGGSIQWPFRLALTGTVVTGIKSSTASRWCKGSFLSCLYIL